MAVTRFAPSPTGLLHVGHAYSAWFSEQAAEGERFLLRIEDIDSGRSHERFVSAIYEDLEWLGLSWESPVMRQSERFPAYEEALNKLREAELLYPCFCTRADIRREIKSAGAAPHGAMGQAYPGTCRSLSTTERERRLKSGAPHALRLDVEAAMKAVGELTWHDRERGQQQCAMDLAGDVVLARKDVPTSYHLSVTVDDAAQGISLVTRGLDLFESTHVHRLLQALLDLPTPEYWHHPLITDEQGERLSKRSKSVTLRAIRESGATPEDVRRRFPS
ncbi:MAG: tRNA glutamyl-Q(34) synthetase GluQRS [Armatimonadetes bacterium]|nr:tRNA glutamyl-Q(34) synthetase GluQRS [Armatimonadota bacterium]